MRTGRGAANAATPTRAAGVSRAGPSQGGRLADDTPCQNCWDFGSECCEPFRATDATLHQAVDAFLDSPRNALRIYGPIEDWDVAQVTSFHRLFDASRNPNAEHFNADVSRWDTANVVDMSACFRGAAVFDADLSRWDVGRVRRMDLAFFRDRRSTPTCPRGRPPPLKT